MQNLFKSKTPLLIFFGTLIGIFTIFSLPTVIVLGLSVYVIYTCRKHAITPEEKKFITYACSLAIALRIALSFFNLGYGLFSGMGSDIFGDAMSYEGVGAYIKELVTGIPLRGGIWGDNLACVLWLRKIWQVVNSDLGGGYTIPGVAYWYGYFNILWGLSFLAPKILNGLMWVIGSFWIYLFFRERFTPHPECHGYEAVDEWHSGGIPPRGQKTENKGATGARLADAAAKRVNPWGSTMAWTKFALLPALFLPSSLIFSSSGLKDSLVFLFISAIIFSSHTLERSNHRGYAAFTLLITPLLDKLLTYFGTAASSFFLISVFVISIIIVTWNNRCWLFWGFLIITGGLLLPTLRPYVHFFVLSFGLSILVRKVNFKKIFIGVFLISVFSSIILGVGIWDNLLTRFKTELRNRISESVLQSYNTAYGNSAYHIFPEKFYVNIETRDTITYPEIFLSYLNGLRYVFLEPTPFTFKEKISVAMFPETCFMWFFTPFIILGIITILRINTQAAIMTILFLLIVTSLLALGQGNMGTLIRTRYMIMPWYFMIGILGLNAAYSWIFKSKSNDAGSLV
jgi:hypothetical protein